jgi:hypothetical protein
VDRAAAPGGARIGVGGVERRRASGSSGVKGEGIGLEAIDIGDRDPLGARRRGG